MSTSIMLQNHNNIFASRFRENIYGNSFRKFRIKLNLMIQFCLINFARIFDGKFTIFEFGGIKWGWHFDDLENFYYFSSGWRNFFPTQKLKKFWQNRSVGTPLNLKDTNKQSHPRTSILGLSLEMPFSTHLHNL